VLRILRDSILSQYTAFDPEPSPEFNQRCLDILAHWETGVLHIDDARKEIVVMRGEAQTSHHIANQGRAEQLLGFLEGYSGNLNDSVHHFERARAMFIQVDNKNRIASCDLNLGESYRYKGDFNRARALFEKAYEAFKSLNDTRNEALALGNKGQMLLSTNHLDEAEADLTESCRLTADLPLDAPQRFSLLSEVQYALTLLHLRRDEYALAWDRAKQAMKTAEQSPKPLEKGFANRAVAEVLSVTENLPDNGFSDNPDHYFQVANEAFREINAEGEIARTMFAHAKSLARRGRRMTAARKLQMAMVIFARLGMIDDAAKAAETQLEVL
jgi:tetratricopeptide (TPR) repeat protein